MPVFRASALFVVVAMAFAFIQCSKSRALRPSGSGGIDGGNSATADAAGSSDSPAVLDGRLLGGEDAIPLVEQVVEPHRTNVTCSDGVTRELAEFLMPVSITLVHGMTTGPDGNLWFTLPNENTIGRMTPTGRFVQFSCSAPDSNPFRITAGPDGNLWVTLEGVDAIARVSPDGTMAEFPLAASGRSHYLNGIAAGPDGNLWFADSAGGMIGRISPAGSIVEFPIKSGPDGIVAGPDGNMWLTQSDAGRILRMSMTGQTASFPVPQTNGLSMPEHITLGPDGNLWFTEGFGKNVGRITPSGTMTEFPIPNATMSPIAHGITSGGITSAAGAVWVTMQDTNTIFRVSIDGTMTECPLPDANGGAGPIALVPDGRLYFSEKGNKIACLTP